MESMKNSNIIEKKIIDNTQMSFNNRELVSYLIDKNKDKIEEFLQNKKNCYDLEIIKKKIIDEDDVELLQLFCCYFKDYLQEETFLYSCINKNSYRSFDYIISTFDLNIDIYFLWEIFFKLLQEKKKEKAFTLYDLNIVKTNYLNQSDLQWQHKVNILKIIEVYDMDELEEVLVKISNLEVNIYLYLELFLDIYKIEYISGDKFDFLYMKIKSIVCEEDILKLLYEACVSDNMNLFSLIKKKFNLSDQDIIKNFKGLKNQIFKKRNMMETIIYTFGKEIAYYFYQNFKENILEYDELLLNCIRRNNEKIINEIQFQHINITKLKKYFLLPNINYIHISTLASLKKSNMFDDKNFLDKFLIICIENHNKDIVNWLNKNTEMNQVIFKKIKKKVTTHIKRLLYEESDDYDWWYIDWLHNELKDLHLYEMIKNIFEKNEIKPVHENKIYQLSFLYWSKKNNILDNESINIELKRTHSNFGELNTYIFNNIEIDNIMVEIIKERLKDKETKLPMMKKLYEFEYSHIIRLENVNEELRGILNECYNDKKIITPLFVYLIQQVNKEKTNYLLTKINNKFTIKPSKYLIQNIIHNDNFYLLNRVYFVLQNKGDIFNKFCIFLLKESIYENNFLIFEWVWNHFQLEEKKKEIITQFVHSKSRHDINDIKFYLKIALFFDENIKYYFILMIIRLLSIYYHKNQYITILIDTLCTQIHDPLKQNNILNEFIMHFDVSYLREIIKIYAIEGISELNLVEESLFISCNQEKIEYCFEMGYKLHQIDFIKIVGNRQFQNKLIKSEKTLYQLFKLYYDHNNEFICNVLTTEFFCEVIKNFKRLNLNIDGFDDIVMLSNNQLKDFTIFIAAVEIGILDFFDYLYFKNMIDLSQNRETLFHTACVYGRLEMAQHLLKLKPNINISIDNDLIFTSSCTHGQIKVVKWLYSKIPEIHEETLYKNSICGACYYGHIHLMKWLFKNILIDIKVDNDYCFIVSVENEFYDIVDWICSIETDRYEVVYNDDKTEILSYNINKELIITESKNIEKKSECPICYEKESDVITCCDHQFCYICLNEYHKKNSELNCPYCRRNNMKLFWMN